MQKRYLPQREYLISGMPQYWANSTQDVLNSVQNPNLFGKNGILIFLQKTYFLNLQQDNQPYCYTCQNDVDNYTHALNCPSIDMKNPKIIIAPKYGDLYSWGKEDSKLEVTISRNIIEALFIEQQNNPLEAQRLKNPLIHFGAPNQQYFTLVDFNLPDKPDWFNKLPFWGNPTYNQ